MERAQDVAGAVPPPARGPSEERLYLLLVVPVAVVFALLNPPFLGVPDELQHYYKALRLAHGELATPKSVAVPRDYLYLRARLAPTHMLGEGWKRIRVDELARGLTRRPGAELAYVPAGHVSALPIAFLPPAIVLGLGIRCRAPPLVAFYAARLLTLSLAVALVYAAIRVAPFGKRVFALVGLLPMTVQQIASISYDALHVGALLLLTACALALARRERVLSTREAAGLAALAMLAANVKPGYVLVPLVLLLAPGRAFPSASSRRGFLLGTLAACVATFALGQAFVSTTAPAEGADPGEQAARMLADPLSFVAVLARTLAARSGTLLEGLLFRGGRSGSAELWFYVFAIVGAALVLRAAREPVLLSRRQRVVLLATAGAQGLLLVAAFYLYGTAVGAGQVNGLQGRYFLALLPCVLVPLHGARAPPPGWSGARSRAALVAYVLLADGYALLWIWRVHYG